MNRSKTAKDQLPQAIFRLMYYDDEEDDKENNADDDDNDNDDNYSAPIMLIICNRLESCDDHGDTCPHLSCLQQLHG